MRCIKLFVVAVVANLVIASAFTAVSSTSQRTFCDLLCTTWAVKPSSRHQQQQQQQQGKRDLSTIICRAAQSSKKANDNNNTSNNGIQYEEKDSRRTILRHGLVAAFGSLTGPLFLQCTAQKVDTSGTTASSFLSVAHAAAITDAAGGIDVSSIQQQQQQKVKEFVDPQGFFTISIPSDFYAIRRTVKGDLPDAKSGKGRRGASIFTAGNMAKAEVISIER